MIFFGGGLGYDKTTKPRRQKGHGKIMMICMMSASVYQRQSGCMGSAMSAYICWELFFYVHDHVKHLHRGGGLFVWSFFNLRIPTRDQMDEWMMDGILGLLHVEHSDHNDQRMD